MKSGHILGPGFYTILPSESSSSKNLQKRLAMKVLRELLTAPIPATGQLHFFVVDSIMIIFCKEQNLRLGKFDSVI